MGGERKIMQGIVDNKTKLIKMMYNEYCGQQEIPPNSHVAEIIPCPFCKGNVGYIVKPLDKTRKRSTGKSLISGHKKRPDTAPAQHKLKGGKNAKSSRNEKQ